MPLEEERRRHERAEIKWPVTLETPGGILHGETKNISESGAYVECERPPEPGDEVVLRVMPPDDINLKIIAEVIWAAAAPPYGIGLAFTDISERNIAYIAEAVRQATNGRSLR